MSGVKLGNVVLSGTKTVVLHLTDYVVEHPVAGLEGGPTERLGRMGDRIELRGFFYSGSDDDKTTLLSYLRTAQNLDVPSTIYGQYLIKGDVVITDIDFYPAPAHTYPYYDWTIRGIFPVSGTFIWRISPISQTSGIVSGALVVTSGYVLTSGYVNEVTYVYIIAVLNAIDYTQRLPILPTIHGDYSQRLPILPTIHPDYTQRLPIMAGVIANYVRRS